jgi:bifunctional non-homologous end joining protein LigD
MATTTTKKTEEIRVGRHSVVISNRKKIYWPEEGYTKGDLLDYYDRISDYILPHLKDRPLSLKRNPNGITDPGFYHKDAGEHAPSFVTVFPVESGSSKKTIDYIVCNNKATLLYVVNLGCIEINPWNSTIKKPDHPTWLVIDIDPSDENTFEDVVDVALVTKSVLDKAGVDCYCKTSGSTGLHIYLPMKNRYDYDTVRDFAHIIAALVQEQLPGTTTLERSLSKRGPKIYVDYLQNSGGQTLASVYSLRPVKGAHVSTPLEWKEVNHKLHPSKFNIRNIWKRLEKKGDLFQPVLAGSTDIHKALKKLQVD